MAGRKRKQQRGDGIYKQPDREGWVISWKGADGRRNRRTVKVTDFEDARKALAAEKLKVEQHRVFGAPVPSEDAFAAFAEEFLEYQRRRKANTVIHGRVTPETLQRQTGIVRQHLIPFFGQMRLAAIRKADVNKYVISRTGEVSGDTIIKEIAVLKRLFNVAISLEKIPSNPALKTDLPKASEGRTRHLTIEEWWRLFDACRILPDEKGEEQEQWLQHAAGLAVALGTRRGELLHTTVPDIDLVTQTVHLRRTKSGKTRLAHINALAVKVFEAMRVQERKAKGDKGKLFQVTPAQLSVRFIRACKKAGIEDFSFHDLRHTFASLQIAAGTDLYRVQVLLGHSDPRMTQRYAHLEKQHLAEAAQRLNTILVRPALEGEAPAE
jgi:integrase